MFYRALRMFQIGAVIVFFLLLFMRPELMNWRDMLGMTCFLTYLAGHSGKLRVPRLLMVAAITLLVWYIGTLFIEDLPKGINLMNLPNRLGVLLGSAANLLVILANGGYMPVDLLALDREAGKHVVNPRRFIFSCSLYKVADANTRLHYLCDRLRGFPLMPQGGIFSVGHFLIMYGLLYLFVAGTLRMVYAMLIPG